MDDILSGLHHLVDRLGSSGQLLAVLQVDFASAHVVLRFLAEQTMNERLATSATKCLEHILMHAPWREEFEGFLVKQLLCVLDEVQSVMNLLFSQQAFFAVM